MAGVGINDTKFSESSCDVVEARSGGLRFGRGVA
jgi:hypothetical protein